MDTTRQAAMDSVQSIPFIDLLRAGRDYLSTLEQGEELVKRGAAFGDAVNDSELSADLKLSMFYLLALMDMKDYESGVHLFGRVTVEGNGDNHALGDWWATVDPLDGSLNYKTRGRTIGLPYSSVITVLDRKEDATFGNVVGGFVTDLRTGDVWSAFTVPSTGQLVSWFDNATGGSYRWRAESAKDEKLDLGSQIVIGEMYYPENRELLARAFAGTKGWLRNPGSAAYEMALVASGQAVAYICDRQKQHELGAAYALVKGAGGVAVDFDGVDLDSRVYDFKTQTPVILAANTAIASQILERLNK